MVKGLMENTIQYNLGKYEKFVRLLVIKFWNYEGMLTNQE